MRTVVLAYHAVNIGGNDYHNNDHVALREDLDLIASLGYRILPLSDCVDATIGNSTEIDEKTVAITFDDGSCFDWYDLEHPTMGYQESFRSILASSRVDAVATSFVIASPEARMILDRTCLVGRGWWTDDWWSLAAKGNFIQIGNHSWDHNHPAIAETAIDSAQRGSFSVLNSFSDGEAEIAAAQDFIISKCSPAACSLFAYPYGDYSDYIAREYLPSRGKKLGLKAAFTTEPIPLTRTSYRWLIGRYVCGHHWKSSSDLKWILNDAFSLHQ